MPGFGPAAEVLLFRQKDPKPLTPRPFTSEWADASSGRAGQLAALKQGQPRDEGVRPERRAAGGGQDEVENRGHREVGSAFHSLDWFVVMPTLFSIFSSYPRRRVSRIPDRALDSRFHGNDRPGENKSLVLSYGRRG